MSAEVRSPHRTAPLCPSARRARAALALVLAATLAAPTAQGSEPRVVELPPALCDVCAPGQPAPPASVQEELRRINRDVNWRKAPQTGDTIALGSATRIWFQRAWASGRLQPGVANPGRGVGAGRGAAAMGAGMRRQPRASLAARSRSRLADRRSTRDEGRSSRSRRGRDESSLSGGGRSSFGTGSSLGTNRSANTFGDGGSTGGMQ